MLSPTARFLSRLLRAGFLFLGLYACVDPFSFDINGTTELLVVDGVITNAPETQEIRLTRSRSTKDSTVSRPVMGAKVEVLVNNTLVTLKEATPGAYQFPAAFRGKIGDRYQLRFTTTEGARYESTVEQMEPVAEIEKAYDVFNPEGIRNVTRGGYIPSSDIYVDFQEPANERNFYLWRWTLYEYQDWCATCKGGLYQLVDLGDRSTGSCVKDNRVGSMTEYDYVCLGFCWDIFYNPDINILSDQYVNGRPQVGRLAARIPLQQSNPCLVKLEQLSLTVGAYRYYKMLQDQTQNSGTLADSPPAPLAGNVRNLDDPRENVVGYFSASGTSINRYWLDRKNTTGGRYNGLFYFKHGRFPNIETRNVFRPLLPSSICVPSRTRTDVQPEGWQ